MELGTLLLYLSNEYEIDIWHGGEILERCSTKKCVNEGFKRCIVKKDGVYV